MHRHSLVLSSFALIALTTAPVELVAQARQSIGKVRAHELVVAQQDNPVAVEKQLSEHVIHYAGASFLKLDFRTISLGYGSRLEVQAKEDGALQTFRWNDWHEYGPGTVFFNGDTLTLRLIAGPLSKDNGYDVATVCVGNPAQTIQDPLTICGGADDRLPATDPRVGRMIILAKGSNDAFVGTAWLYTPVNGFATAGHNIEYARDVWVQFNVPASDSQGGYKFPLPRDQYQWTSFATSKSNGVGNDWGVFTTKLNVKTSNHAGTTQGSFFRIGTVPTGTPTVEIPGYGADATPKERSFTLQSHSGAIVGITTNHLQYDVDVRGGNSGSPVVLKADGSVIGIHSHGFCDKPRKKYNVGTRIDRIGLQVALDKHASNVFLVNKFGVRCPQPSVANSVCTGTNQSAKHVGGAVPRNSTIYIQVGTGSSVLNVSGFGLRVGTRDNSFKTIPAYIYKSTEDDSTGKPGRLLASGTMKVGPLGQWYRARTCPPLTIPGDSWFFIAYDNPDPGLISSIGDAGTSIRYYYRNNGTTKIVGPGQKIFMRQILCGGRCQDIDVSFSPSTNKIKTYLQDGQPNGAGIIMIGASKDMIGNYPLPLTLPFFGEGCFLYNSIDLPPLITVLDKSGYAEKSITVPGELQAELKYYKHYEQIGKKSGSNETKIGTSAAAEVRMGRALIPAPPTRLQAGSATTSSVKLTWQDNSEIEGGFRIGQSTNGTTFSTVAEVGQDVTSHVVDGLQSGKRYWFRVRSFNVFDKSAPSKAVDIRTLGTIPKAPTRARFGSVTGTSLYFGWDDNATNETHFEVQLSRGSGWSALPNAPANATGVQVDNLNVCQNYTFRVRACNSTGCSAWLVSPTQRTVCRPARPTSLIADELRGTSLTLKWTMPASNHTHFVIEYSLNGSTYHPLLNNVSKSRVSQGITGLRACTNYWFRIAAANVAGLSSWRASKAYKTICPPTTPGNFKFTQVIAKQIKIGWTQASTPNVREFQIEFRAPSGTSYVKALKAAREATFSTLATCTTYGFRIRAWNTAGYSPWSGLISTRTTCIPASPANLRTAEWKGTTIVLNWDDRSNNEDNFVLEWGTNNSTWPGRVVLGRNVTSYRVNGLRPCTTYYWKVAACNRAGCSSPATHVQATRCPPSAPFNLRLGVKGRTTSSIHVRWDHTTPPIARSFSLGVKKGVNGSWNQYKADITQLNLNVTGLVSNQKYFFRVRAWNTAGPSPFSAEWSAQTRR